mmetsp:Transcript_17968/g.51462  ORF Transcript_17968/g.51462 Transcript_17968/m.51462 type:complete len:125 (-) Transcript_17968:3-377(-)
MARQLAHTCTFALLLLLLLASSAVDASSGGSGVGEPNGGGIADGGGLYEYAYTYPASNATNATSTGGEIADVDGGGNVVAVESNSTEAVAVDSATQYTGSVSFLYRNRRQKRRGLRRRFLRGSE